MASYNDRLRRGEAEWGDKFDTSDLANEDPTDCEICMGRGFDYIGRPCRIHGNASPVDKSGVEVFLCANCDKLITYGNVRGSFMWTHNHDGHNAC